MPKIEYDRCPLCRGCGQVKAGWYLKPSEARYQEAVGIIHQGKKEHKTNKEILNQAIKSGISRDMYYRYLKRLKTDGIKAHLSIKD